LAPLSRDFDDMATLLCNEIRSLRATQRELEQLVATDRLTGIGNRRQFEQQAEAEAARAKRYGIPVSLILFDVDNFKRINDRYGHQVGDSVLVNLTRRVAHRLRDTDSIARWGGEEFAILTPCTPISGAEILAEKIRRIVAEEEFDVVGKVTISLGVAQMLQNETAARWIARADELLYEAKHAGRNQSRSNALDDKHSAPFVLVWGDQFLVNHPVVDAEHAELFRLANELILSAPACTRAELLVHIGRLGSSLEAHFNSEEAVLTELGCPPAELERHAQMHLGLMAEFSDLRRRFEERRLDLHDVGDFIVRRVTIGHLVSADLALFGSLVHSATIAVGDEPRPSLRLRIQRALLG
jgi:diguanylate cyclase (GGDEF)-like protein/hemerythrin-like metal-binding protein